MWGSDGMVVNNPHSPKHVTTKREENLYKIKSCSITSWTKCGNSYDVYFRVLCFSLKFSFCENLGSFYNSLPELPGSLKRKLNLWVITCWYSKTNNLACPWITNKIHLWGGFCVCTYGFSLPTKTPVLVVVIKQVCYNSQYYQPACSPSSCLHVRPPPPPLPIS
jgi:hypothetical protein